MHDDATYLSIHGTSLPWISVRRRSVSPTATYNATASRREATASRRQSAAATYVKASSRTNDSHLPVFSTANWFQKSYGTVLDGMGKSINNLMIGMKNRSVFWHHSLRMGNLQQQEQHHQQKMRDERTRKICFSSCCYRIEKLLLLSRSLGLISLILVYLVYRRGRKLNLVLVHLLWKTFFMFKRFQPPLICSVAQKE